MRLLQSTNVVQVWQPELTIDTPRDERLGAPLAR